MQTILKINIIKSSKDAKVVQQDAVKTVVYVVMIEMFVSNKLKV